MSVYVGGELCGRSTVARTTPPDVDTSPAHPDLGPESSGSAGSMSNILGPAGPVNITTTKDVSRVMLPSKNSGGPLVGVPAGPDGEDLVGDTEQTTGWLDPQQKIHNLVDGYLDIVGSSDEGPMTVKIACLWFSDDNTGHYPFELGPETELSSLVSLAPTEPPEASSAILGSQVSNHTTSTFDALSVPPGVFSTYNATSTSASAAMAPITVRLKADVSVHNSATRGNLCVTYNSNYDQVEDGSPVYLQECNDSYIPGTPSASRESSETQLWQYDPVTREVKPLLSEVKAMDKPGVTNEPLWTSASDVTATSSAMMIVETAPPLPVGAESTVAMSVAQGKAGTPTMVPPASSEALSYSMTRRDRSDDPAMQKSKPKHPKSSKPDPTTQKQGGLIPSLVAVPLVDPYNLVFTPKSSIAGTRAKIHPPA
ncbi:hypothetical protein FRC06_003945 [Ceratobasidium sp. 370]|nr:hypothetical protein FRC06_003945 [Ceratobasidium sp. 370]